jgi:hypothetical protein
MADHVMQRRRPSTAILSGESADVYFARAEEILRREGLDPLVSMEVFARQDAVLCGIDEAKILLAHALEGAVPGEAVVEALDDGDDIAPRRSSSGSVPATASSGSTKRRSSGSCRRAPAGRRLPASASRSRRRSRSSRSAPATCIPT